MRRIAFATCEDDFRKQMSRTFDDLSVLAEHHKWNDRVFDGFSAEFRIIHEGGTFRFNQKRAGSGNPRGFRPRMGE
jgi:hypothetical protein